MDSQKTTKVVSDTDILISNTLRGGVLLSSAVVILGGIVCIFQHFCKCSHFATFQGQPAYLCSLNTIIASAIAGRGEAIIQLGVLILLCTPVVRVALSVIGFIKERDGVYIGVTLFVLAVLLYSIIFAVG